MNSDTSGTKVIKSNIAINTMKYGTNMALTRSIDILVIPQPTNSTEPTGGVIEPKHMLKISMTPKCTGSIPSEVQIGKKIGVKIKIAGVMSKNIPMTRRMMLISKKITYLLSLKLISASAMALGMPEKAITHDIAEEAEIKNKMMPDTQALSTKILVNDLRVTER